MYVLPSISLHYSQLLETNINFWLEKYNSTLPHTATLLTLRDALYEQHKFESAENIRLNLTATANERDRRELFVKCLHIKLEAASYRLENARNHGWWITQHLRMLYRKLSIINKRFDDTLQRIQWLSEEYAILTRIEYHMQKRIQVLLSAIAEMIPVAKWVEGYLTLVVKQQILLDCIQETVIKEELNRLSRDERVVVEFDSLLVELMNSVDADSQYTAEKVGGCSTQK